MGRYVENISIYKKATLFKVAFAFLQKIIDALYNLKLALQFLPDTPSR